MACCKRRLFWAVAKDEGELNLMRNFGCILSVTFEHLKYFELFEYRIFLYDSFIQYFNDDFFVRINYSSSFS